MLGTTFGGNHLACAAALAVLEVIQSENLMTNATSVGNYLLSELKNTPGVTAIRGRGLMIGFEMVPELKDLRKLLLWEDKIFTGEAKPNVIRLLPSLALSQTQAETFMSSLKNRATQMLDAAKEPVPVH
jgi:acetylornithine aminotransferase